MLLRLKFLCRSICAALFLCCLRFQESGEVMTKKVLVVDDSKTFRAYLQEVLEQAGYEVFTASNGAKALELIPELQPDLITVDVAMPVMDGFEFCRQLRLHPEFGGIPAILVTASDPVESRERGFEVGAIDFIAKPFESAELQYAARKILEPDQKFSAMRVLIAEDTKVIRLMIKQIVQEVGATPILASDGAEALDYLRRHKGEIDLLITDNEMPELTGLELCGHVRKERLMDDEAPLIFVSGSSEKGKVLKAFDLGASDYIFKPFFREGLLARLKVHLNGRVLGLEKKFKYKVMEEKFAKRTQELLQTQEAAIDVMGALVECRDSYTGEHIKRTKLYIKLMAEALCEHPKYRDQIELDWIDNVMAGAPLHDIGKIGVRDDILMKPGRLSEDEFGVMKEHSVFGRDVLNSVSEKLGFDNFLQQAAEIAGSHHERWDGTGYPDGLKGEEIPLSARLMAVADVYDALVSPRVYKQAMTHRQACDIIEQGKGTHFDPLLVEVFFQLEDQFKAIRKQFPG